MAKEAKNAACRFCGQQHIIENGGEMTEPQLEECATMRCTCDDAKLYQETANRRGTAKQRAGIIRRKCWRVQANRSNSGFD